MQYTNENPFRFLVLSGKCDKLCYGKLHGTRCFIGRVNSSPKHLFFLPVIHHFGVGCIYAEETELTLSQVTKCSLNIGLSGLTFTIIVKRPFHDLFRKPLSTTGKNALKSTKFKSDKLISNEDTAFLDFIAACTPSLVSEISFFIIRQS